MFWGVYMGFFDRSMAQPWGSVTTIMPSPIASTRPSQYCWGALQADVLTPVGVSLRMKLVTR